MIDSSGITFFLFSAVVILIMVFRAVHTTREVKAALARRRAGSTRFRGGSSYDSGAASTSYNDDGHGFFGSGAGDSGDGGFSGGDGGGGDGGGGD